MRFSIELAATVLFATANLPAQNTSTAAVPHAASPAPTIHTSSGLPSANPVHTSTGISSPTHSVAGANNRSAAASAAKSTNSTSTTGGEPTKSINEESPAKRVHFWFRRRREPYQPQPAVISNVSDLGKWPWHEAQRRCIVIPTIDPAVPCNLLIPCCP
jgi:hypothetical protein